MHTHMHTYKYGEGPQIRLSHNVENQISSNTKCHLICMKIWLTVLQNHHHHRSTLKIRRLRNYPLMHKVPKWSDTL